MGRIFKECDYGERSEEVLQLTYDFYFKGVHPKDQEKIIQQIVKFIGDYSINYGTYRYANQMAELEHDVYFYQFEYHNPGGFGVFKWLLPFLGSTHCTEMRYVLGKGIISKFRPNEHDKKMIEVMTTYFTNFAKYGNPNGREDEPWEKHESFAPFRHFKIDLDESSMAEDYQDRRAELWDKLRALNVSRAQL
uniref:COesterase domain-containing protein n=1 Tax=Caenorhabditis tropicalis TaxID=1561998 RepID=A0A1I7TXT0_9PELO